MFKNIGIQNELKKLCKKYPNNYTKIISFNIKKTYSTEDSFKQIIEISDNLLNILKEFGFENIEKLYFDKLDKKNVVYFCPNLNKFISFNIDLLNGVELKKEDIKFI